MRRRREARQRIRETAWLHAGIVRQGDRLEAGLKLITDMTSEWPSLENPANEQLEAANLRTIAELVLRGALARLESRGAHFRIDYPLRRDAEFGRHSLSKLGETLRFA